MPDITDDRLEQEKKEQLDLITRDKLDALSQYNKERSMKDSYAKPRDFELNRSIGDKFGKGSKYDAGISEIQLDDRDEYRAQNQTTANKWGNATVKMAGLAGAVFLDTTIGTVAGLTNVALGGEDSKREFSDFYNNAFSIAIKDWTDSLESIDKFPNLRTREEANLSLYGKMGTANFWADTVLKNAGYAIGTVAAGSLTGGLMGLAGTKSLINEAAKSLVKKGLYSNIDDAAKGIASGLHVSEVQKSIKLAANSNKFKDSVKSYANTSLASLGEAKQGALESMQTMRAKLDKEHPEMSDKEKDDIAKKSGNFTFVGYLAVLSLTNSRQMGSTINKFAYQKKDIGRITLSDATEGAGKIALNTYKKPTQIIKKTALDVASEMTEEQTQFATEKASEDFYTRVAAGDAESLNEIIESLGMGIGKAYGTEEGWENGITGGILGFTGIPSVRRIKKADGSKSKMIIPTLNGGVYDNVKEVGEVFKRTEEKVSEVNQILGSDVFKRGYKNAVIASSFEDDKDNAETKFDYDNAESNQFILDADTFIESGLYSEFKEQLESVNNTPVEELRSFFDENGLYKDHTDEEFKSIIKERTDLKVAKLEKIRDLKRDINAAFPNSSEEYKTQLTQYGAIINDVQLRIEDLKKKNNESFVLHDKNIKDTNDLFELAKEVEAKEEAYAKDLESITNLNKKNGTDPSESISELEKSRAAYLDLVTPKLNELSSKLESYKANTNINTAAIKELNSLNERLSDFNRKYLEGHGLLFETKVEQAIKDASNGLAKDLSDKYKNSKNKAKNDTAESRFAIEATLQDEMDQEDLAEEARARAAEIEAEKKATGKTATTPKVAITDESDAETNGEVEAAQNAVDDMMAQLKAKKKESEGNTVSPASSSPKVAEPDNKDSSEGSNGEVEAAQNAVDDMMAELKAKKKASKDDAVSEVEGEQPTPKADKPLNKKKNDGVKELASSRSNLNPQDDDYYDDASNQDVEDDYDEISKQDSPANSIAVMNQDYVLKDKKLVPVSDEITPTTTVEMLDPTSFPVGTELRFVVIDDNDQDIYAIGLKEKVKWGAFKAANPSQEVIDAHQPIAIYSGDVLMGYVHTESFINKDRVKVESIPSSRAELAKIRKEILENPSKTAIITVRGAGSIKFSFDGSYGKISDKSPKGKLSLVDDKLVIEIPSGGVEPIGISTKRTTIAESKHKDAIKRTILSAVAYHMSKGNPRDVDSSMDGSVQVLANKYGLDLREYKDLREFLKLFITPFYQNDGKLKTAVLARELEKNIKIISSFTMSNNFNGVDFKIYSKPDGQPVIDAAFTARNINTGDAQSLYRYQTKFLKELNIALDSMFLNVNRKLLKTNQQLFVLGDKGGLVSLGDDYESFLREHNTTQLTPYIDGSGKEYYRVNPLIKFQIDSSSKSIAGKIPESSNPPIEKSPHDRLREANPVYEEFSDKEINKAYSIYTSSKGRVGKGRIKSVIPFLAEEGAAAKMVSIMNEQIALKLNKGRKLNKTNSKNTNTSSKEVEIDETVNIAENEPVEVNPNVGKTAIELAEILTNVKKGNIGIENEIQDNEDDQAFRPFPIPKTQLSEIEEGSNKIVIPGLRADFQADVVDAVLSEIGLMFIDGKSDVTIVEAARVVLDKIQNEFYNLDFFLKMDRDELLSYEDGAYFDKNRVIMTKKTEYLKLVLDNKDVIYRLVQSSLKQASIFKQGANRKEPFNENKELQDNVEIDTKVEIVEDEVIETNEVGELPEDVVVEFNKATYTENLVDKISVEVKKFLSGIIVVDNEMNPKKNWFGYQATINYRTVYEQVQSATLGLEPDINTIIEALEKKTASTPWMRQVIDRIIKAPSFIKNRLVKNLTNHMNRMVFVLYNIDASGFTTFTVADANENGVKQVLLKQWNEDHAMEGLYDEITGDSIRSKFKELYDVYRSWSGTPSVEEIVSWFKSFGITTKEETISRLIERHNREGLNILTDENSPIYNLSYFIRNSSEYGGNITKGSPINTSPSIIKLAEETAKDSDTVVASSFRAGVKTVYSFGTNKFLVNRIRNLRNLLNIDKLLSIPFNKNSFMLNELKRDENFRDTLNYFTVSLEAIKQKNKSSRNKRSMSEISKAEIEVFKIANFQALRKKGVTIKNDVSSYYANFLTPTTSDKPTVMGITTKLAPIKYTDEGTLTTDSYHFLFDQIIRCEMDRIIHVHMMNKDKKSNNNGDFSKNGLLFHIIPQLNDLDYMWNDKETGEINPNVLDRNSTEYAQIMNDVLIPTLEAELNVKKQLWRDSGIGYGTSGLTPFLDITYIKKLSLNKKDGESDYDYYNRKVDLAALDMVLQYKVAYVNMFNSMFTDIANYSKGNNKKTWDNVMKRLAGAIAPRLETQHPDKEIKYLFIKDPSSKSRQINEIKELIGDKKSQNYEKIDEADAQEWITLYEFIGSLIADGAIKTEGLGELIRDTITKEVAKGNYNYENEIRRAIVAKFPQAKNADGTTPKNTVLDEYLSIIYQPQKPVFFGAEYDSVNNLEDVVYIKSSAFVLVPGLTPMHDKMRILAERNGVQRIVTASTSVKLGSVTNPIDPWLKDEDGNIVGFNEEITDEQLEASSKTLSRSNWGIQLEKQYNPDTHTVNKVSQASKNLLNGMLDVSGFFVNGVEMTGRKVRDHYNELFSTIYKNQYDKFANKLGLVFNTKGNVIAFNVDKVRDVIVEEAISRNYYPQELEAILLDYELTGITFASNSSKIEPLLNALVEKNVLKIKMEGKQFTVGSETMFTGDLTNSNIVTTDSYNGSLQPSRKVITTKVISFTEFLDSLQKIC